MAKSKKTEDKIAPQHEQEALAKVPPEETALAPSDVDDMFGGPEPDMPIEVAWPEIKLTKTDDFKMPDGSKVKEIVCNIVFVKRSRACWLAKYDGNDNPPDCASDNCIAPNDDIVKSISRQCGEKLCSKATWRKETDPDTGKDRNVMDCKESLNMIIMLDGMTVPRFIRVRSYSFNRKSPLAAFFTDSLEPIRTIKDDDGKDKIVGFSLRGKFQTVKVRLTLDEIKVNGFPTSMLQVQKVSTLEANDPLLPVLGKMFKKVEAEFVVVHKVEETETPEAEQGDSDQSQEYDGGEFTNPDEAI